MGQRVHEEGASEGRAVIVRIGVAPTGNITPRESGQTSLWSLSTRELDQLAQEAKQMTASPGRAAAQAVRQTVTGAASRETVDWHAIDWPQAHRLVRRLQARIVQATQQGRWGKVQALQHLLTHSYSGKVVAVRRVRENQGKNTPGVDQVLWNTPEKKTAAVQALRQRGYQPRPLRRVYVPKRTGKLRPLGIPTMADRAMQSLYLLALDPVAEVLADPNSYGFRVARSPADAIAQCFTVLSNRFAPTWVLEGDIRACFDHISHAWLVAHTPMDGTLLRKWLTAGYLEQHILHPTDEGSPPGGSEDSSHNLAKRAFEFALPLSRTRLRPRYGQGFKGAPLQGTRATACGAPPGGGGEHVSTSRP
jgi:hypothetical protein